MVARFSYGGITLDSQPISIRCVFGGVNVFNYNDLYSETVKSNPRPVVLQSSIKDDFSATNSNEIHTTFEDGYYVNSGNPDAATIKVLLQFKSDVYGNGYEINAHNATLGTLDESGALTSNSIFRGPLNLIAFSQSEANGAISAKAQDNICFAVYEGVTLNNIILKSGDLTPDPETGKLDLTDLDYAGTTVEVMGDDVTIEYSRISNGRNIVRAFGDAYDDEKVINVVIRNSILGYSREFILRIGSNCFVACPYGTELDENDKTELEYEMEKNPSDLSPASPLLPGDDGDDYKISKQLNGYSSLSESEKADYDEKYIKTFVTVENSVFEEAGIFAIALETHFAGNYLHAGSIFGERFGGFTHWHNLAKTSYGAKLTFEGDVRLYNWKPLSEIDSSVLVDNNIKNVTGFGGQNFNPEIFEFSVSDMVKYLSGVSGYRNIIDNIDGTDYVHNGIVIYGGGKNYSIFDNNVSSASFNHAFQHYPVTFGDVKQELLTLAAGGEEFAFFIYDKSGTFTYNEQKNLKNKYDCIYN